jgi:N-acetyltransferase 10
LCLSIAARGRGKSASIGLCLAGAIAFGYSNIFVTAPSPENLKTCFEFVLEGLKALNYLEHLDYEVLYETNPTNPELGKCVTRLNVFRNHRQTIQYILPTDAVKLSQAELVAIDEAAAIPLALVKQLMGPYLVFLSSTVNGYEGTGRSLSLKLIDQLRKQQGTSITAAAQSAGNAISGSSYKGGGSGGSSGGGKKGKDGSGGKHLHEERWKASAEAFNKNSTEASRSLKEITLSIPIRYNEGDPVEKWLNALLCLDVLSSNYRIVSNIPSPKDCQLYLVDRDALFSYHPLAEALLQKVWSLYTSAHYKNSPNDLQILSDAPAHRLFVLLGPQGGKSSGTVSGSLPDILCMIQVAFEGKISAKSIQNELSKGNKASGDMIPWIISQQFNDNTFATLSGCRIVRVATHPDVQKMGYGSRAVSLLNEYFSGNLTVSQILPSKQIFGGEGTNNAFNKEAIQRTETEIGKSILEEEDGSGADALLQEEIKPKAKLPPLLTSILDRPAERLHWVGISFGLTSELLSFWTKLGFSPLYLRQTINDITGEHSCVVIKELDCSNLVELGEEDEENIPLGGWLLSFVEDYRRRLIALFGFGSFRSFSSTLGLLLLDPKRSLTSTNQQQQMPSDIEEESGSTKSKTNGKVIEGEMMKELFSFFPLVFYFSFQITDHGSSFSSGSLITSKELLSVGCLSYHDFQRLEMYSRNLVDFHMILDLIPLLAHLFFSYRFPSVSSSAFHISLLQAAILFAVGLQYRDVDSISLELDLPSNQILAFFNKTIRKFSSFIRELIEKEEERKEKDEMKAKQQQNSNDLAAVKNGKKAFSASRIETVSLSKHRPEEKTSKNKKDNFNNEEIDDEEDDGDEVRKEQKKLIMSMNELNKHSVAHLTDERIRNSIQFPQKVPKILSIPKQNNLPSSSSSSSSSNNDNKPKKDKKKRKNSDGDERDDIEETNDDGDDNERRKEFKKQKKQNKKSHM